MYIESEAAFGHVNLPALPSAAGGAIELPDVGARLNLIVLGYSGTGQLRLADPAAAFG